MVQRVVGRIDAAGIVARFVMGEWRVERLRTLDAVNHAGIKCKTIFQILELGFSDISRSAELIGEAGFCRGDRS
jgi:hypothetical protein